MIFSSGWQSIFRRFARVAPATVTVVLAALLGIAPETAHADVAFRKKAPPAKTNAAQPSGGDTGAADSAASAEKTDPAKLQAQDPDDPTSLQAKEAAAAAAQAALVAKAAPPPGPPIYKRWKFWAVVGVAVVGAVALVWGGSVLAHRANGGDVMSCPATNIGCFGEGR